MEKDKARTPWTNEKLMRDEIKRAIYSYKKDRQTATATCMERSPLSEGKLAAMFAGIPNDGIRTAFRAVEALYTKWDGVISYVDCVSATRLMPAEYRHIAQVQEMALGNQIDVDGNRAEPMSQGYSQYHDAIDVVIDEEAIKACIGRLLPNVVLTSHDLRLKMMKMKLICTMDLRRKI
jgi:hypothetical protein